MDVNLAMLRPNPILGIPDPYLEIKRFSGNQIVIEFEDIHGSMNVCENRIGGT
jgi:hypothetical protein